MKLCPENKVRDHLMSIERRAGGHCEHVVAWLKYRQDLFMKERPHKKSTSTNRVISTNSVKNNPKKYKSGKLPPWMLG